MDRGFWARVACARRPTCGGDDDGDEAEEQTSARFQSAHVTPPNHEPLSSEFATNYLPPDEIWWPGAGAGGAVEARTTSSVRSGGGEVTTFPCRRRINRPAASRAFSTMGCRTVVSGGLVHAAIDRSSYPITERSPGTFTPAA